MTVTDFGSEKTFRVREWKYDNSNRCSELVEKALLSMNGKDTLIVTARYAFFYRDSQKAPYRILQDGNTENLSSEVFLKYGVNGKKIQDSTIYTHPALGRLLRIGIYKYDNAVVYYQYSVSNINWTGSMNGIPGGKQDTIYLDGDNVKEYRIKLSSSSTNSSKYIYSYDNKINPFLQQNIASAFYEVGPNFNYRKWFALYSENDNLSIIGYNKNNITRIENIASPQSAQLFAYVYDQHNYPSEATISFTNVNGVAKVKFEYSE